MKNDSLNPSNYFNLIRKLIPPGSVVLPINAPMFTLSDYQVLHPSGKAYVENKVYTQF